MQVDDTSYETDQALFRTCSLVAVAHLRGLHIEKCGNTLLAINESGEIVSKLISHPNGSTWVMDFANDQEKRLTTELLNRTSGDTELKPAGYWDDALASILHVVKLVEEADCLARTVVESCDVVQCVPLPPPFDVRFVSLPPPVAEQPPAPVWETEEDMIADLMAVEVFSVEADTEMPV